MTASDNPYRDHFSQLLRWLTGFFLVFSCLTFPVRNLNAQDNYPVDDTASMINLLKDSLLSPSEKLVITLNLSNLYSNENPSRALFYDSLSVVLSHQLKEAHIFITALENSAKDFQKTGNYENADILFSFIIKQLSDSNYAQLAQFHYELGQNDYLWGRYKRAASAFQKSRAYYEKLGDKPGMAKTLMGEARVWLQYNDFFQAVGVLQRATDIFNQLEDQKKLADAQLLMGKIMQSWGQQERARYFYFSALDYYISQHDRLNESRAHLEIGNLFIQDGQYQRALKEYRDALDYSRISQDRLLYSRNLRKLGEAYYYLKNYDSARYYQQQAFNLIKRTGNRSEIGSYYFDMGQISYKGQQLKEAGFYADSALMTARKIQDKSLELSSLKLFSDINRAKGAYRRAYHYLTAYNEIYQQVFSEKNRKMVSDMEVHYEADQKAQEYDQLKKHDVQTQLNLSRERNFHNLLIVITVFIVVVSVIVIFFIQYENKINKRNYALIYAKNQKITAQQKKLEALNDELFTSRESYRSIVENATIGMYQISPSGKILFANKALLKMLSLESLRALQEQVFLQIRDAGRKQFIELLKKQEIVIGREGVWQAEGRNRIYVNESAWIIKDNKGKILYYEGIVEDITKRKIAEDQVQQTQAILKQKNAELIKRNEEIQKAKTEAEEANTAKTMFLANFSHEIRTPLNSIIGFAYLLLPLVKSPEGRNFVDSILVSGKSLLSLINDILDLSKIQAGKLELNYEPAYIPKIIGELKQIFYPQVEARNLEFSVSFNPRMEAFFVIDGPRLRQVLFNIVGNAIKFTEQGSVRITAEALPDPNHPNHYNLVFVVKDTGPGIPEEEQSVIFDAFKQVNGDRVKRTPGTGLGLSISQRLIEMMGGSIHLESVVGKGTTFVIVLENIRKVAYGNEASDSPDPVSDAVQQNEDEAKANVPSASRKANADLEKQFGTTFRNILNKKSISEIRDLGEALLDYAQKRNLRTLQQQSLALLEATRRYDIETIENILGKMNNYFQ